jgi:paraquat-inducible protein A
VSGLDRLAGAGIALAAVLLVGGLTLPMMSIDRLYLFEQRVSIVDAVVTLLRGGEWAVGTIVALFSIVFPGLKLALAWRLWRTADVRHPRLGRRLQALSQLGKWSMLDVFLVAILIAAVKISLISDVHVHYGLYLFIAAVVLSTVICQRLAFLADRLHDAVGAPEA